MWYFMALTGEKMQVSDSLGLVTGACQAGWIHGVSPAPILKPQLCDLCIYSFSSSLFIWRCFSEEIEMGREFFSGNKLCLGRAAILGGGYVHRRAHTQATVDCKQCPFLEVPDDKAFNSFQIMRLRPRGHQPPPSPRPLLPHQRSSQRKAPSAPFLRKNLMWPDRNDLLVNITFFP